jgi:hypothetical protein
MQVRFKLHKELDHDPKGLVARYPVAAIDLLLPTNRPGTNRINDRRIISGYMC